MNHTPSSAQAPKILIVDDNPENLLILEMLLKKSNYGVISANNGQEGLKMLKEQSFDLIISDILMPVMDGFQFCREVKEDESFRSIPFIFHTSAYTDKKDEELAFKLGVDLFIPKPVDPFEFNKIICDFLSDVNSGKRLPKGVHLGKKEDDFRIYSERLVEKLEKKMTALEEEIVERKRVEEDLKKSHLQLRKTLEGTINAVAKAIEARDLYVAGHQRRVAKLACAIANNMGLPEEQVEGIRLGALIHDIGKIQIPAEILGKPAKLMETEYALVKDHAEVGYSILKDIEFPWPVAEIAHQHHERFDGSGYPRGLSGKNILFEARIVAVADVVEAIANHRPYRPGLGENIARGEIEKNKGRLYDPEVVKACLQLFDGENFSLES